MPNLLNGLVNGWVKVNSKHVIFPREDGRRERRDSEAGASLDDSSSRGVLDRSRGKSSRKQSHQTITTASTAQTASSTDPEALAIKKFNSKRRGKLQRTISHSDLLREMANERRPRDTATSSRTTSYDSNKSNKNVDRESVRQVAGFFGSEQRVGEMNGGSERPRPQRPSQPVTTGKYLNEDLFWQLKQSKAGRHSNASSVAGSSVASPQSPVRENSKRIMSQESEDSNGALRGQVTRHSRRESGSHASSARGHSHQVKEEDPSRRNHASQGAAAASGHQHSQCTECKETEGQLLAAYDDIRYLRDVSLRSEFSNKTPSKPKDGLNNRDPCKRLAEITGRHRRQIEQMTRETSRKQHDIHFKHSKMSMICKTLNDESSIRRQEALALEEEVRELTLERDKLATDVQRLRTESSIHEQEEQELELLRERMTSYEKHSLERAEGAIRERDEMIGNLSSKLERTLETLQIEREQQRQRRQIIFPGTKSVEESSSVDVAALQEELRKAKEAAKASEALLEATRTESAKREIALTVLESRLKSMTQEVGP